MADQEEAQKKKEENGPKFVMTPAKIETILEFTESLEQRLHWSTCWRREVHRRYGVLQHSGMFRRAPILQRW